MKKHIVTIMSCIFITILSPQLTFSHGEEDDGHDIQEVMKKFQEDSSMAENQKNEQKTEEGSHLDDVDSHHSNYEGTKHEDPNTNEAIHDEDQKEDLVHEDDGGHSNGNKEYVEKTPNYNVLGAFAAINIGFIFLGFWIKRLRRKDHHL